ncbi:MAG: FHA domain-containing protein, partial [Acidobacteriaceae bacterium]|nr:FHA domain-containing protein [Acidobacteriaceae bacterium]
MSVLEFDTGVSIFEGLKSYSRTDVELINRFGDLFLSDANWELWLQEGLGALLEVAGEQVIFLQRTNEIEPGDTETLSFQREPISVGRDPDNDIVLAPAGVGRHHARITNQNGRYFLEDLGSTNGTYLNDRKVEPHKPVPLNEGAQFLIFPYQFSFSSRQVWSPQEPVKVGAGAPRVVTWNEAWSHEFGGTRLFSVKLSPDIGSAVLRVSDDLLNSLIYRISHAKPAHLTPADTGAIEFLLLSVLERANRVLRFPFFFSLVPFEPPPKHASGISIECVLDLTGIAGVIEIFLPGGALAKIHHRRGSELPEIPVSWPILAATGYSDLSLEEFA